MLSSSTSHVVQPQHFHRTADNANMDGEENNRARANISVWTVAYAIEETVRVVRRARGKLNPEQCPPGSELHANVTEEFIRDCIQSVGEDVSDEGPHDDVRRRQ